MRHMLVNLKVRKPRDASRAAGRRPVQTGLPNTRKPGFVKECRRQSRLASQSDGSDNELQLFLDDALKDVDGWTE